MTITVSPLASQDLRRAYHQIARDNRAAADRVLARIVEIIGLLASGNVDGPEVTLRDGRRVRTWPVPPYRIYYRKTADHLEVVRVYHQAQRPIEA